MNARTLREQRGLSLDELGRRALIERSRLSRFERGYLRLKADEVGRLANELGVPAESLVEAPPNSAA